MREHTFIKKCFVLVNYIDDFNLENSPTIHNYKFESLKV